MNIINKIKKCVGKKASQVEKNINLYKNKIIVIKYGGHAMINPVLAKIFAKNISLIKEAGILPIIVHGGGPQINQVLSKFKIKPKFINGLRYTNSSTLEIAEMVLSGSINKKIASNISLYGSKAIGISGSDNNLIKSKKLFLNSPNVSSKIDIGFVGTPTNINIEFLKDLLEKNYIPVIAPIGIGTRGQKYNINADTTAGSIASAIKAKRLIVLTNIPGVINTKNQLITILKVTEINRLISSKIIYGGMIPKVQTCVNSIKKGVDASVILDGRVQNALLLELFTDNGLGTLIKK